MNKRSHVYVRPPSAEKSAGPKREIPVTKRIDSRQVKNNAGGYVYSVEDEEQLKRFLVLGGGGTYYKASKDVILENLKVLDRYMGIFPADKVVELFIEMRPRVPKVATLLACVAYCFKFGPNDLKNELGKNISQICWTGDDLFRLVDYSKKFQRGWGRSYSRAIRNWYHGKPNSKLVKQMVKYQGRYGWTQRDVLKLASVYPLNAGMDAAFAYSVSRIRGGDARRDHAMEKVKFAYATDDSNQDTRDAMEYLLAIERMWEFLGAGDVNGAIAIAKMYEFPWELFPTEMLKEWKLWEDHLLDVIGPRALLRQLNRLTQMGLVDKPSTLRKVIAKFDDAKWCQGAHPASFVIAMHQYSKGEGGKGDGKWTPIPALVEAIEKGFMLSYRTHSILGKDPEDKRIVLGIDVSPSMSNPKYSLVEGMGGMLAMDVAAIMGGLFVKGEAPGAVIPLKFSSRSHSESEGIKRIAADSSTGLMKFRELVAEDYGWGGTDCSLPVIWATKNRVFVEAFVVITDNETWVGKHPNVALEDYRQKVNPKAKMIVIAAAPNNATIADPHDPLSMNCVGFDLATPVIMERFMKEELLG